MNVFQVIYAHVFAGAIVRGNTPEEAYTYAMQLANWGSAPFGGPAAPAGTGSELTPEHIARMEHTMPAMPRMPVYAPPPPTPPSRPAHIVMHPPPQSAIPRELQGPRPRPAVVTPSPSYLPPPPPVDAAAYGEPMPRYEAIEGAQEIARAEPLPTLQPAMDAGDEMETLRTFLNLARSKLSSDPEAQPALARLAELGAWKDG